jgi:hypothetical protein
VFVPNFKGPTVEAWEAARFVRIFL